MIRVIIRTSFINILDLEVKLLSNDVFDSIYRNICKSLEGNEFNYEKSGNCALFLSKKVKYKMEIFKDEKKICLKSCDNDCDDEWEEISSWLFEENGMSDKYINMICNDFAETMCCSGKTKMRSSISSKKSKKKVSDSIFFANRLVNIFPELKSEIFIEKECYSGFRGTIFVEEKILPKILDLLKQGKDLKRIERLFKLLSDLYKNASIDIRCLITMGIMNNITDDKAVASASKYIDDDLKKAWEMSKKFKGKKIRPARKTFYQRLVSKENSNK